MHILFMHIFGLVEKVICLFLFIVNDVKTEDYLTHFHSDVYSCTKLNFPIWKLFHIEMLYSYSVSIDVVIYNLWRLAFDRTRVALHVRGIRQKK